VPFNLVGVSDTISFRTLRGIPVWLGPRTYENLLHSRQKMMQKRLLLQLLLHKPMISPLMLVIQRRGLHLQQNGSLQAVGSNGISF